MAVDSVLGKGKAKWQNQLSGSEKKCTKGGSKAKKAIESAARNWGKKELKQALETMTSVLATVQDKMEESKAKWADERTALQSQLAVERMWRMHYEGIVRTTENGPRDLERELREAAWPSRRLDAKPPKGAARRKRVRKL
jgi:hypothetical protein